MINNVTQIQGVTLEELMTQIEMVIKKTIDSEKNEQPRPDSIDMGEYLTRQDISDLLQISITTVHNWTKSGKLKAYGLGRRVYYKSEEVQTAIIKL